MNRLACPSSNELSAYAIGLLDEARSDEIDSYLLACGNCQEAMDSVGSRQDSLLAGLRSPPSREAFSEEAECHSALQRIVRNSRAAAARTLVLAAEEPLSELGQIGPYELVEKLGHGGMGTVYKAFHRKLKRLVAVKVLPADKLRNRDAVARFEREMEAVGKLVHPHIVMAHDAGEIDGQHFLVMEYVEGIDLSQLIARCGRLPIADACELTRQAALGLAHAHAHGLVHRDVKPANLMLDAASNVKILDLGLALLDQNCAEDNRELTATGQVMGTLDYMAPEQGGDSHVVDSRADIYSLGATLYKLLTGQAVYHGPKYGSVVQKMTALALELAPPIQMRREGIPGELAAIVHRMLAKHPDERIESAAKVAELLAPFARSANLPALAAQARGEAPPVVAEPNTKNEDAPSLRDTTSAANRRRAIEALIPPPVVVRPVPPAKVPVLDVRPRGTVAGRAARGPWPLWALPVAAGVLTALLLLALVAFIRLRTPHGEVLVELGKGVHPDDVQIEVRNGGELSIIDSQKSWTINIREGEYDVSLTSGKDQMKLDADSITVRRGKQTRLRVSLLPLAAPVNAGERSVAERAIALGGTVAGYVDRQWWYAPTRAQLPSGKLELRKIDLAGHQLSDRDWESLQLGSTKQLTSLYLAETSLNDDSLRMILDQCPALNTLDINRTVVSPTTIQEAMRKVRFVSWTPSESTLAVVATSEDEPVRWRCATEPPGEEWMQLGFDDRDWPKIELPLGGARMRGRSEWTADRVWLRHNFSLDRVPSGRLYLRAYCDDAQQMWLNSKPILKLKQGEFCAVYAMFDLGPAETLLQSGDNVLAASGQRDNTPAYFDAGLLVIDDDASEGLTSADADLVRWVLSKGGAVAGYRPDTKEWTRVTSLEEIPNSFHVEKLMLDGCGVTDRDLEHLWTLPGKQLRGVHLADCPISDQGLDAILAASISLKEANLRGTSVTLDGIGKLLNHSPTVELWASPKVDADAMLLPTSEKVGRTWRYTQAEPPAEWTSVDFDDAGWKSGEGAFASQAQLGGFVTVRTPWKNEAKIWLRQRFHVDALPQGMLVLRLFYDDVREVRLNDRIVFNVKDIPLDDPHSHGEYRLFRIGTNAADYLHEGDNILTIFGDATDGIHGRGADAGLLVIPHRDSPVANDRSMGLKFDGRSSRIELPEIAVDMADPFTLELFVDLQAPTGEAMIASNLSADGGFRFSVNQDGWWSFKWAKGRALFGRGGPGKKAGALHAAVVWDGDDVKIYVDGASVGGGGGAIQLTDVPFRAVPIMIGAEAGADGTPRRHLTGTLKQLRLSRGTRYQAAFRPPTWPLRTDENTIVLFGSRTTNYVHDEERGPAVVDLSGNNYHSRAFNIETVELTTHTSD